MQNFAESGGGILIFFGLIALVAVAMMKSDGASWGDAFKAGGGCAGIVFLGFASVLILAVGVTVGGFWGFVLVVVFYIGYYWFAKFIRCPERGLGRPGDEDGGGSY